MTKREGAVAIVRGGDADGNRRHDTGAPGSVPEQSGRNQGAEVQA